MMVSAASSNVAIMDMGSTPAIAEAPLNSMDAIVSPAITDAEALPQDDMMAELHSLLSYIFYSFSLFIGLSASFQMSSTIRNERSHEDSRASDEANSIKRFILLQSEMRRDVIHDIAERAAIEARYEMHAEAGQGAMAA
jgi:hypothetical protein